MFSDNFNNFIITRIVYDEKNATYSSHGVAAFALFFPIHSEPLLFLICVDILVGWLVGWLWFNVTFSDISAIW